MKLENIIKLKLNNFEIIPPDIIAKEKEAKKKENVDFVIPKPEPNETEETYVSRCMKEIGSEYDTQEQALAVCYAQLEK